MNIKKGDKVIVIAGNDKGKEGVVQVAYPKLNKVVVENVNVRKKHRKPNQKNPEGSIAEVFAPIHVSNVKLVENKTAKKATKAKKTAKSGEEK